MADLTKKLSVNKTIEKKSSGGPSPKAKKLVEKDIPDADIGEDDDVQEITHMSLAEFDVDHPTGDKTRDKVRKLLVDVLFVKGENIVEDKEAATIVANAIENAMFYKFADKNDKLLDNGQPYKQKYRTLNFNIKDPKNKKLRTAILHRRIIPSQLVEMSSDELANDELRKQREQIQEKMTRDAMPSTSQMAASTNMFKCTKCKQRKCTYYQMQTRSADEPLTTFVQCVNCGNRWRF